MDSLPKNMTEARIYFSKLKAWAVIATMATLIVVGFYSLESWRFWQAIVESKGMRQEIERISGKLDRGTGDLELTAGDLRSQQQRRESYEEKFRKIDSNNLIGMLSNISFDTQIDLPAISAGDPTFANIGSNTYQSQPISFEVQGNIDDIYQFISTVQKKIPIVSVSNINISNPGTDAKAQIQLVFYMSPQPIADAEGAD